MLPSFILQAGVSSLRAVGAESLVPNLAQSVCNELLGVCRKEAASSRYGYSWNSTECSAQPGVTNLRNRPGE